jgi:hypothetical protein
MKYEYPGGDTDHMIVLVNPQLGLKRKKKVAHYYLCCVITAAVS